MTAEFGITTDEKVISPEQERLETAAKARVDSGQKLLEEITTTTIPRIPENVFTPIVATINFRRATDWLSRVEEIRDLQLVSPSTPQVIFGLLPTGQEIYLSGESSFLGFRRNVYGVVGGEQLNESETKKLLRRYSPPLKKRYKLKA